MRSLCAAGLVVALAACAPANVVPASPNHPANPAAEAGESAPPSATLDVGQAPAPPMKEMPAKGHDHDHGDGALKR